MLQKSRAAHVSDGPMAKVERKESVGLGFIREGFAMAFVYVSTTAELSR